MGSVVRQDTMVISYVGHHPGKTFTTPVSYRRAGDEIVIRVMFLDGKNWWRNFLDGDSLIALQLNETDGDRHAGVTFDDR